MDIVALFKKAREIKDRSDLIQSKFAEFFDMVSPGQHKPFFEYNELTWFIDGVRAINKEVGDDLAWYFWEITIDGKQEWEYKFPSGNCYKIKDDETFIAFLQDVYFFLD